MMTQAKMDNKKKRLYAIMYPDSFIDGGGPLTIQDMAAISMKNIAGLITRQDVKIPKPLTSIIDFSVAIHDTSNPYSFAEALSRIAENFEADEYILVTRGFRFQSVANLSGFKLIFPHRLLDELRADRVRMVRYRE